jgi:hypothetical protein
LPADFDVSLQGVDTRLKALQPGTTLGDIAYSSATANTNTRLPIGTSGQVLAVSGGGVPAWTTTADVTPLTTKGDLFTFTTADARLGVGANGTILTADSSEATGIKWAAPAGGGKVLQVVSGTTTSAQTITSGTYTDTNITATITPTSATSKILVLIMGSLYYQRTATNNTQLIGVQLLKNATTLFTNAYAAYYVITGSTAQDFAGLMPVTYIDSPASTSALTYKLQANLGFTTSGSSIWQHSSTLSTITLLEIGA